MKSKIIVAQTKIDYEKQVQAYRILIRVAKRIILKERNEKQKGTDN